MQLAEVAAARRADRTQEPVFDDRGVIGPGDAILLIVEDDPHYARVLVDLAHDNGFKVLVTTLGSEALDLAQEYKPAAISLDIFLPDMSGWTVLSHLKQSPATRHIPVQIISLDDDRQHGLTRGAFAFMTKPTTTDSVGKALSRLKSYAEPRRKQLLLVEDNEAERLSVTALLGDHDIDILSVGSGGRRSRPLRRARLIAWFWILRFLT